MLVGLLLATVVLVSGGGLGVAYLVHTRSLRHIEAQRVVGGLPPAQWDQQHTLDVKRLALEERRVAIQEAQAELSRAREGKLFDLEMQKREIELANARTRQEAVAGRLGGNFFQGS